ARARAPPPARRLLRRARPPPAAGATRPPGAPRAPAPAARRCRGVGARRLPPVQPALPGGRARRDRRLGPAGRAAPRGGGGPGRGDLLRAARGHPRPVPCAVLRPRLPRRLGGHALGAGGGRPPGLVGTPQRLLDAALALRTR